MLIFDDIIRALEHEGIVFWHDTRYRESQKVARSWISNTGTGAGTGTGTASNSSNINNNRRKSQVEEQQQQQQQQHQSLTDRIGQIEIPYARFRDVITPCARLFFRTFNEENIIPDWSAFTNDLTKMYQASWDEETTGQSAQYIPILQHAPAHKWGVSVCSIDGQRYNRGDASTYFTLQSASKPITYAIGMTHEGEDYMARYIDVEPAGRPFNTQDLDPNTHRPFNASVNSGAIMAAGILASRYKTTNTCTNSSSSSNSAKNIPTTNTTTDYDNSATPSSSTTTTPVATWRNIVDDIRKTWSELAGYSATTTTFTGGTDTAPSSTSSADDDTTWKHHIKFSEETYRSEKDTAYNNFAIGKFHKYSLCGRRSID